MRFAAISSVLRGAWKSRLAAAALIAVLGVPVAPAATLGSATARVGTCSYCGHQILIPITETQFETPAANLSQEFAFPNQPPFYTGHARAVAGIDMPAGALYGSVSTFVRQSTPGQSNSPGAIVQLEFEDTFEVLSDTLPNGTLVDVTFDLLVRFRGSAGAAGFGPCCVVWNNYQFSIKGESTTEPAFLPHFQPAGWAGVLAGGIDGEPVELGLGSYSAQAIVGDGFYLRLAFGIDTGAIATAEWDRDAKRYVPGQSETQGTASLFLGTTVNPAAMSFTAAAREAGAAAYLRSVAAGLVLPGAEVFDPENLDAHLLPLVAVPLPGTAAFFTVGLAILGARARRRSVA